MISTLETQNLSSSVERKIMSIIKSVKKYKISEQPSDFAFWQSKSYDERIDALEQIRKEFNEWRYSAEQRFQRVYRIIKCK